jgi:hypothetical protein
MIANSPPLIFEVHLGMLRPASSAAEAVMQEIRGRVAVKITGGTANQRRRNLYWAVAELVVPLLNDRYDMTLNSSDLHHITREKLGIGERISLPSGETYFKPASTSNRAMSEADRADYTNRAFAVWSTWTGVPVETLRREAELST